MGDEEYTPKTFVVVREYNDWHSKDDDEALAVTQIETTILADTFKVNAGVGQFAADVLMFYSKTGLMVAAFRAWDYVHEVSVCPE